MATDQLRVKLTSTPNLPATYVQMDANGQAVTKHMNAGVPGKAFDPKVSENGDQWVTVNGVVNTGVAISTQGEVYAAPPNLLQPGSYTSNATSVAYEASHLIKQTAGVLFSIDGYNSKASAQFILIFDSSSPVAPAEGAIPVKVVTVPATANFSIDLGYWGRSFSAGIWVTNSSTGPTKTIGSADCWFDASYV